MDELTQKLGPEYAALMAAYRDTDLHTQSGLETGATCASDNPGTQ
jgi:hypothetical protein